jgi:hypothetical protein
MSLFIPADYAMVCPNCEEAFIAKHLNSRYCSKACKIWANNLKARQAVKKQKNFQSLNDALAKNRLLLRGYRHSQIVHQEALQQQGYDFQFMTHQTVIDGVPCIVCYDVGYQIADKARKLLKIIYYENAEL